MHHLSATDVERLLPPPAAIAAARATAAMVAAGAVHQADRVWHTPPGMSGQIGVMPSHLPDDGRDPALFVTKLVGVFPNATPSVDGIIAVQDGTTGAPLATIDAAAVTAARTAAGSGLSIDLLARRDASTVAIIGAGVQGWAHLMAARAVRPITAVRVWNRTEGRAQAFAERARALTGMADVEVCATPGDAARGADIVCACTNSATPVLTGVDIRPGAHVTAIGAYRHDTRELAADLIAAADHLVVDDRTAAGHEAGDVLLAIAEEAITADAVLADLAELVSGAVTLDRSEQAITIYKSVGTSAMDAVAVRHLLAAEADRHLAVYGTLAPGQPNHDVLPAGRWSTGTVAGRRLVDGWEGYPGLVLPGGAAVDDEGAAGGSGQVPVHLLTTREPLDWTAVDAFEGVGYRRRRVVVRLDDGASVIASTYVLAAPPPPSG